ncbi:nuclear transport factor 2 family protein [Pleurocapsales cyanobacterium LEGE 06147]|nr:nuclear transport factor 2 family protein [Pleurocapsales cyanobacterium LEGE 06147]
MTFSVSTTAYCNSVTIDGITEPVILNYFATLNGGEFTETAALFAENGALHAPFESPIVGREAIATYLEAEAKGMKLLPREGIKETVEEDLQLVQVTGKVETPLFGVNVSWKFLITPEDEILAVKIKLLASPQELLKLRR